MAKAAIAETCSWCW